MPPAPQSALFLALLLSLGVRRKFAPVVVVALLCNIRNIPLLVINKLYFCESANIKYARYPIFMALPMHKERHSGQYFIFIISFYAEASAAVAVAVAAGSKHGRRGVASESVARRQQRNSSKKILECVPGCVCQGALQLSIVIISLSQLDAPSCYRSA